MKFDPILDYDEADSEFEPYFRIVQTKVIDSYLWYKDHTTTPRLCFRITGATVILFSITIPAVSAYSFPHKNITIALMALVSYRNIFRIKYILQMGRKVAKLYSL